MTPTLGRCGMFHPELDLFHDGLVREQPLVESSLGIVNIDSRADHVLGPRGRTLGLGVDFRWPPARVHVAFGQGIDVEHDPASLGHGDNRVDPGQEDACVGLDFIGQLAGVLDVAADRIAVVKVEILGGDDGAHLIFPEVASTSFPRTT